MDNIQFQILGTFFVGGFLCGAGFVLITFGIWNFITPL